MTMWRFNSFSLAFAIFSFLLSLFFLPLYTGGDQLHYRALYEALPQFGFYEGFSHYGSVLGSKEPVYFLLVYFSSVFAEKDILMASLNGVLGYFLARLLIKKNVSAWVLCALSLNFYLLVLFFSAERLKLSVVFYLLALNFSGFYRYCFFGVSVTAHVQTVILLFGRIFSSFLDGCWRLLHGKIKYHFLLSFAGFLAVLLIGFFLRDHIVAKYEAYSNYGGAGDHYAGGAMSLLKPAVFLIFSLYYAEGKKFEVLAMHAPIMAAAFFVGDERVVIFSYFIFMSYALAVNRGLNLGVFISSFYFFMKGVLFLDSVYSYGDGFSVFP